MLEQLSVIHHVALAYAVVVVVLLIYRGFFGKAEVDWLELILECVIWPLYLITGGFDDDDD